MLSDRFKNSVDLPTWPCFRAVNLELSLSMDYSLLQAPPTKDDFGWVGRSASTDSVAMEWGVDKSMVRPIGIDVMVT